MPEQIRGTGHPRASSEVGLSPSSGAALALSPGTRHMGWPAAGPLARRDLHFPGSGDVRGLPLRDPPGLQGQRGAGGLKQQRSRKERSQVLKSDAFSVLSHRYTNAGGLAEAYFHPETPPHVPDLLGCVCC